MTLWLTAVIAMLPAFGLPAFLAMRGGIPSRMVAVQLAGCIVAFMLAMMTFAFEQSSFMDLALCLTLVSIAGTFLLSVFMERWL